MTYLFLDTETLGLSLMDHDVWEIAYAFDDSPIFVGLVPHSKEQFQPEALAVNHYWGRCLETQPEGIDPTFEKELLDTLNWYESRGTPVTVVGANPSFDTYRLSLRWGWKEPWHHRLIDVCVYAMPLLGVAVPMSLSDVRLALKEGFDWDIPAPDHTAANDVSCTRAVFNALWAEYRKEKAEVPF